MLFIAALACIPAILAVNPKRGIAFAESDGTDISKLTAPGSQISWIYNWGTTRPSYLSSTGIPYIPMQWGGGGIESFGSAVEAERATIILVRSPFPLKFGGAAIATP